MSYTYQPTLWEPEPDDYETTPEGWALFQQQQGEVMQRLKLLYPELASWGDLERMNAWGGFAMMIILRPGLNPIESNGF